MSTATAETPAAGTTTATETTQAGAQAGQLPAVADPATTVAAETAAQTDSVPAEGSDATKPGPPEQYSLVVPVEGAMSADAVKAFEDEARLLNLNNEQAQAYLGRRFDAYIAQADADLAEVKAHPVYGGAHLAQTQQHYKAVMDRFAPEGTPEGDALRGLLKASGRGDSLGIVAFVVGIGKAMAEDTLPGSGQTPAGAEEEVSLHDSMYRGSTSAHKFQASA